MDVSALHAVTEDLAAHLSEVTQGDLGHPTSHASWDIGDLYLHLIENNLRIAEVVAGEPPARQAVAPDRGTLANSLNLYGGGLEGDYRRTARHMEAAFAAVLTGDTLRRIDGAEVDIATLYEQQISSAVVHTWDIAQVLGLPYQPPADITLRVLNAVQSRLSAPFEGLDNETAFKWVLRMSGRLQDA
ncbi:maleylpyruvate isomerase family mycothiol-dependent enzyme [Nocardia carnea]|uniref:maleylpyruvate isomerase family mycothiol-dependent enzyme n=1 Tax=Nocardia carnea TaxID=37328 RepID=UPI00245687D6|nr:maleylpyruvate isomerase family mycothiol-dependent enzyme [Nocardia carnea]